MIKNTKILFICWFFYPKLGGVETVLIAQIRYLIKKGYKISVLTSIIPNLPNNDNFEGAKIFRREFINSGKEFSKEIIESGLEEVIQNTKPDVVHFHNGSYPAGSNDMAAGAKNIMEMYKFLRNINLPLIDHAHNAQLKNPEATTPLRELDWDYLICVSNFVASEWKKLGYKAKNTVVVYNGVDINRFENIAPVKKMSSFRKNSNKVIFFPARVLSISTGQMSKQKNFALLLQACKILINKNIKNFHLVAVLNESMYRSGINQTYEELKKFIKDNNLQKNISFISEITPEDMPKFYAAVDVVCVPSIKECFALVYLEAMASGKIPIATATGGSVEAIQNGKNGFLVNPDNPKILAEVLLKIIENKIDLEKIGKEGRKTIKEKFNIENMMAPVEKIYNQLI